MVEKLKQYTCVRPRLRRAFGWILVIFGFVMFVTPLTPGGMLFFVGLELLGIHIVSLDRIKQFLTVPLRLRKNAPSIKQTISSETIS